MEVFLSGRRRPLKKHAWIRGGHDGTSGEGAKFYSDFKAKDASLEIGQVERGAYIYLRNKVTNNLLMLRLNEDDKKLVFNSEIDGQWGTETELVTKSDMKVLKKTDVQFSDGFAEISFPGLTYDSAVCINQEYKSSAGVQILFLLPR